MSAEKWMGAAVCFPNPFPAQGSLPELSYPPLWLAGFPSRTATKPFPLASLPGAIRPGREDHTICF